MTFGRAGTPLSEAQSTTANLAAMKAQSNLPPLEKTDDLLSQRVSEELDRTGHAVRVVSELRMPPRFPGQARA